MSINQIVAESCPRECKPLLKKMSFGSTVVVFQENSSSPFEKEAAFI